jgi:hypothetical protein
MWKNISQLLTLLFTFSDKFARHDKQIEDLERKISELTKHVQQLALVVERQAERDLWREQVYKQALEIERLKLENQRLSERVSLPPSSTREDKRDD